MRVRYYLSEFFWIFRVMHPAVKATEPWGILLAVAGLAVSIYSFQIDYADRTSERKLRAWEIITSNGPVNGGKREALVFLISNGRDLSAAKLSDANLAVKDLSGFDLRNVDLSGANLSQANLSRANLNGANLSEARLNGANLTSANLRGANLNGANLNEAWLDEAILISANLNGADLSEARLNDANLGASDLSEARLLAADLSGADIRVTRLVGANLSGANLREADLRGANLSSSFLLGADLSEANLVRANLSGASLKDDAGLFEMLSIVVKGLTQLELDFACGDESTKLPEGLTIPMCSEVDWFEESQVDPSHSISPAKQLPVIPHGKPIRCGHVIEMQPKFRRRQLQADAGHAMLLRKLEQDRHIALSVPHGNIDCPAVGVRAGQASQLADRGIVSRRAVA